MGKGPWQPAKPVGMFNNSTDPTLISRQLQRIQERRMYLSQQQYSRESGERTNVSNHGHSGSVLANNLSSEQYNKTVQRPLQNTGSSVQDSRTSSANPPSQAMTVPSEGTSSPATSSNQETLSNDQVNSRQELLMEVLSQFENRASTQPNKNVKCSKRLLDSNNGVAFDWGKLPRIGSVHSVRGIVGQRVNTSSDVGSKESSSEAPLSRMGRIKMTELARLILNGSFDNFLNGSSPENQSNGNQMTASGLNSSVEENEKESNQVSGVERRVVDSRVGSSSQDMAVNSVPNNDSYSYRENRQLEATANQMVPSFNQPSANLSASGSFDIQSNRSGPYYNTIPPYFTTIGRHNFQSNQRTNYTTNNGNLPAAGSYGTQSNRRTTNNVNAGNLTTNGSYVLQSNQRAIYNAGTSNRTASGSHDRQSNQRTSYDMNFNHQNVSQMTHGQTPGVYGRTPVRSSYPRSLCSVPSTPTINSSSCYVGRHLTSIPRGLSNHPVGVSANGDYRFLYPHNQDLQFMNRAVRTARVEPLSNQTNIVQPSPRATHAITSNMSNSSTATASSPGNDLAKNAEHDASSCLDCKLLGTCPIKKASEKEKELKDSSDGEPELMITKVTTKDAERGPIERIDVDEWVSYSESLSVKVKQEALDKEDVAPNHEENNSQINNIVNQMRLMAERLISEDGVLDLRTTAQRNEQNPIDKNLNSDSISIQDSVGDINAVDTPQVAVSEVVSSQPTSEATERGVQDCILESSTTVSQEAACEILEESNAVLNRTSEVIAIDELTSSEVTEKSIEDRVTMDTLFASEVTEESIIREHVTEDITMDTQSASEVTAKSIAQDPVTMQAQTASEVIEETFVQEHVTKDNTMDTQLASEVNQESIAQDHVTKDIDIQPVSESIAENLNQGHITDDMNVVDRQTACGLADTDQDAGATKRNASNETITETVGYDNHPLVSLMKKIKSLERCIGFLKQRANSDSGPVESEYDKGDRNYQKYVSMEGGELDDQENDKTVMNTESIGNSGTSRTINQQPRRLIEMSSRDKEAMENLERRLKENQEKLKFQNDVSIRRKYLEERLFMLKKIERISQKYELMSIHDREATNKLEKALERNQEKLKNQKVEWIRKHCLKARLSIFKKIERIRRKYGLPPEEPASFINEDLERRNEDNLITKESFEAEAASEVNTVPPVVENDFPPSAVPEQENAYEFTNKTTADSLQMPKTSAENQETQRLSSETPNEEAERVTSEEESALETLGTGLDDKVVIEEQDPVSSKERLPMAEPSTNNGVLGNVVIKSEGIQHSDVEDAFTLEEAIKAFVEKSQDQEEETSGGKPSSPSSPKNHLEGSSPLQNKNQENRTIFSFPDMSEQDQSDKSVLEKTTTNLSTEMLPLMNCDEIVERTLVTDCEAQPNQLPDIQDLSNEIITISVTDRSVQTERNHAPRKKSIRSLSTDQCGESANNAVAESPASENMARKEKRKLDAGDEHVLIKKEKIDADQENTLLKEKNNNIWDFIKKYSHS